MNKYHRLILAILLLFSTTLPFPQSATAAEFNPNFIISDEEILNANAMSVEDIRRFLQSKPGILKNYIVEVNIKDEPFRRVPAAEFIYERAVKNGINPKFVLVLLQKEQSLITNPSPSQRDLDFATGYGCPDGGRCSERWRGFSKQVNSAILQFKDYMENPQNYRFQVGQTYTFVDNRTGYGKVTTVVVPANRATAALYNYTPHVYNGNYNFWKLWREWFSLQYPDGSLLQPRGQGIVYLIKNGLKHPFKSKAAMLTRYPRPNIITVDPSVLEQYPTGEPIRFPQYALYRSPQGTVYLIVDDVKHGFTSAEVMRTLGINPEEIEDVSQEILDQIPEGKPIDINSSYPMGALLQNKDTGTVYYVKDGKKYGIVDKDILTIRFGPNPLITPVAADQLRQYVIMPPLRIPDGTLITSADPNKPAVYIISDGYKRPFVSASVFESLGYKWENIITVKDKIVEMHPTGEPIDLIS